MPRLGRATQHFRLLAQMLQRRPLLLRPRVARQRQPPCLLHKPRIIIGPGSRVEGKIILKREVELFISDTAEVGGVDDEIGDLDDGIKQIAFA